MDGLCSYQSCHKKKQVAGAKLLSQWLEALMQQPPSHPDERMMLEPTDVYAPVGRAAAGSTPRPKHAAKKSQLPIRWDHASQEGVL